jgi:DNA mismatch repair protein MutL
MSKIKVMPESLANKIAAGEVVERPASVVKELLENSLDAGAGKIDIEIEAGGKRLIRVVDDGEGMIRDDAITAFERHATSKLRSSDELESISTLGFRGEALPSIASVCRLILRTGAGGQPEGTEIEFNGGKLVAVRDIAWPGGTEIEIKDLFFNIPARRKFLKSDSTEAFHIAGLVQHYALANPRIAFMLIRDGREVIRVTPAGSIKERAYQVLGGALLDKLNEVDFKADGVQVTGFTSNPQEQRSSRETQYLFVNKRFVRDQLIGRALSEAYRSMMPSGTYPAAVLFIDVPPSEVDVNVHPAKTQVRFLHEGVIAAAVRSAILKALESSQTITQLPGGGSRPAAEHYPRGMVPAPNNTGLPRTGWAPSAGPNVRQEQQAAQTNAKVNMTGEPSSSASPVFPEPDTFALTPPEESVIDIQQVLDLSFGATGILDFRPGTTADAISDFSSANSANESVRASGQSMHEGNLGRGAPDSSGCGAGGFPDAAGTPNALPGLGHGIKPLGQIRDSYIVATDEEGLLLIDQHVAHERILFEQLRDDRLKRPVEAQPLLVPQSIDLTPAEAEGFSAVEEELNASGIEVMQLSGRTIAITAGPAGFAPGDAMAVVRDVLAVVDRERRSFTVEHVREQIAASMACKAAIKVNMPLTPEKMQWLIDGLMKTANPMTCPHGRPIMMRFGLRDIERGFKRPV